MGFQFDETMAGTVHWTAPGLPTAPQPFHFKATAHAASTLSHLGDGRAVLRGVVHAPPLVDAADLSGVITIRPFGQRVIRYEFFFTGEGGKRYEFVGQKDIRWLAAVHSWTTLPGELRDEGGRTIGTAETRFDLRRDSWKFLRSFRPA
jgi:hypothetical protein